MGEQNEEIKSGFASKWRDSGSSESQKTENTTEQNTAGTKPDAVKSDNAGAKMPDTARAMSDDTENLKQEEGCEQQEDNCEQEEGHEQEKSMAETMEKVKKFLLDNKDILILSGQLALVALVCVVGIKNDLIPEHCCKKRRKKKR